MTDISLVVVGDFDTAGLSAGSLLLGEGVEIRRAASLVEAERMLNDGPPAVELVLLAESRPGEATPEAVAAFQRSHPLVRIWRLLGSWCEGETRSGRPPAGCLATYAHQWSARWAQELARAARGQSPCWSLPLTASPDERALAASNYPLARGEGRLAICARHSQTAWALADACHLGGYETSFVDGAGASTAMARSAAVRAAIWDTSADEMTNPAAVERLRAIVGGVPLVAVASFPRAADYRRASAAGLAAVVSKPFSVHDLLWQVARAACGAAH